MLSRQKVLLAILANVGAPLARVRLFKYAFLVGRQDGFARNFPYYDFVPYKLGPYSFTLERELNYLQKCSFVESTANGVQVAGALHGEVHNLVESLGSQVRLAIRRTISHFEGFSHDDLLRSVYVKYPEYAFNSSRADLIPASSVKPQPAILAVYTIGYEGHSVDSFLRVIHNAGISTILDVRANPVSRKYGFARGTLSALASKLGIQYEHLPELGIPSKDRKALAGPRSYMGLFARYEQEMLPRQEEALARARTILLSQPTVLVCKERQADFCHRGRLATALEGLTGLFVEHL